MFDETLYNQWTPLLNKIARRYGRFAEHEDLVQMAALGLSDAVRHYDESAGAAGLTERQVADIQRIANIRRAASLDAPIGEDGDAFSLMDALAGEADEAAPEQYGGIERRELHAALWRAVRGALTGEEYADYGIA